MSFGGEVCGCGVLGGEPCVDTAKVDGVCAVEVFEADAIGDGRIVVGRCFACPAVEVCSACEEAVFLCFGDAVDGAGEGEACGGADGTVKGAEGASVVVGADEEEL